MILGHNSNILELKKRLRALVLTGRPETTCADDGLCLIAKQCDIKLQHVDYVDWKYYSGDSVYPVPARANRIIRFFYDKNPGWIYSNAPLYEGEYGKLRVDLARHLILVIDDIINGR